jgi:predicted RNA-binding Zn ribbon-like protein
MWPTLALGLVTCQSGDVAFAISSGNLALDFVGTLGERRDARNEHLRETSDVADWLVEAGVVHHRPETDDDTLVEAVALREALFVVVERLLDEPGSALPQAALEVVNRAAAVPPPAVTLRADRTLDRSGSWRAGLSAVARDGLALVDPGDAELKWCADPTCTHPFLDRSRGHRRRWCEMAGCGDRAKAAAYRARRRAAER